MTDQLSSELDALADILDQQSSRLHNLRFRLTELRLLLLHGDDTFVASAADDLATAANRAAESAILRSASMQRVAELLGLDRASGLDAIAKAAPQPYALILEHHVDAARTAVSQLQVEGTSVAATVSDTLRAGRDLLDLPAEPADGLLHGRV